MKLWQKVILGLLLGIAAGCYFPEYVRYVQPIGEIFLRMIKMVIAPLVFFSLVSGITSIKEPKSLGRLGVKATIAFLGTTFFAVIFGIVFACIIKPGEDFPGNFGSLSTTRNNEAFDFITFIVRLVPDNIVGTFVSDDIKQVVFFAIFTGMVLNKMGHSSLPLKKMFDLSAKLVLKMISIVVQMSPYATFSLTSWVVASQGIDIMINLSTLIMCIVAAMLSQYVVFGILILIFGRISPIPFYRKSIDYQILAFSTSSSKATLPTTMQTCRERLGISEASTSFILPLGASINMNGFAINLGLCSIFFAQMTGVTLSLHEYLIIIFTSTLGSIGGAGIPGASVIMLPMVLSSVNLPIEGVSILVGIDRILDMLRTTINITGDAAMTLIIDSTEGTLDKNKYFSK